VRISLEKLLVAAAIQRIHAEHPETRHQEMMTDYYLGNLLEPNFIRRWQSN
jgi:hypothetical protein